MKILVTGGSGYIGSAVVRELLNNGEKPKILVRETADLRNLDGLDVDLVHGDITDFHSIKEALSGCDRVFHLAAIYAIWLPDSKMMYWVNVQGTRNVLEACLQKKIKKVVHTSSVAALGAHGKGRPADESAMFNLWHTRDHYYLSKFRAEQVALDYQRRGLPVVIVNPTNPCGSHDIAPTPNGQLIINIIKGNLPGYVDGGINVSDISDTAKGHVLAMEHGKPGEKYVLGNTNVSVKRQIAFHKNPQIGRNIFGLSVSGASRDHTQTAGHDRRVGARGKRILFLGLVQGHRRTWHASNADSRKYRECHRLVQGKRISLKSDKLQRAGMTWGIIQF
jgi:dihydroflavonol-4-reductase